MSWATQSMDFDRNELSCVLDVSSVGNVGFGQPESVVGGFDGRISTVGDSGLFGGRTSTVGDSGLFGAAQAVVSESEHLAVVNAALAARTDEILMSFQERAGAVTGEFAQTEASSREMRVRVRVHEVFGAYVV